MRQRLAWLDALLLTAVCVLLAPVVARALQPGGAAGGGQAAASRVDTLLADLQKAGTAEQAAALLQAAHLSEAELRRLSQELEKPSWSGKLNALKRSVRPMSGQPATPRAHKGQTGSMAVAEARQAIEREQLQLANQGVQAMQSRLARVRAAAGALVRVPPASRAMAGPVRERLQLGGDPATSARIDAVEPSLTAVGQVVVVRGARFGNTQGRVVILLERELFPCEVVSWGDQRIRVRIPREVRPWSSMRDVPPDVHVDSAGSGAGGSGSGSSFAVNSSRLRPATNVVADLWVKMPGGETGPWRQIEIGPDLALLTPAIDAVTPSDLEPGSDLLVEGRNFGDQPDAGSAQVQLSLAFGGQTIRVDAVEWRDSYIVARVHSGVSGVPVLRGGVVRVRNRLGLEAVKGGVTFTPAMDVADVERGAYRASCHPLAVPPLCLVGESKTIDAYDVELRNGWTVQESWVEVVENHSQGANYGGYFETNPTPGNTRLRSRVVVWADAYSMTECRFHVLVTGPRGTSFR